MPTSLTPRIDQAAFPTTDRIFGWIEYLASLGHRRTGTEQGRRSAEFLAEQFRSFGIQDVVIETAPTPCPHVHEQSLTVGGQGFECFWVNATGRKTEIGRFRSQSEDAKLVYLGKGLKEDFDRQDLVGKIVVCDVEFRPLTGSSIANIHPDVITYDPDGSLAETPNKFDIYSPNNWPDNFFYAQQQGAAGFIGVLQNYMDCYNYNEDYTDNGLSLGIESMEMPALWVSKTDGQKIADYINSSGDSRASMVVDVEYEMKDALNVSAFLPGQGSEIILVHSHHDAVFSGAVQDASGVSEVLALAEYFASRPLSERPKSMMFAATDTHFTDYVGHLSFINARKEAEQEIVLDICIEHIGKEVELAPGNRAVETGRVEPRMVYVSKNSQLLEDVRAAFARNNLGRTYFLPVETVDSSPEADYTFQPGEIVSDAYHFAEAGIPVISMVSGQMYVFHPSDTVDRIPVEELRPVGIAFAEIANAAAHK